MTNQDICFPHLLLRFGSDQGLIVLMSSRALTSQVSNLAGPVVCLIDDDASVRKSLCRLLDSEGLNVQAFGEADEFLIYLKTHTVPVVVLDIWMEDKTAMEVLAHVRTRSPNTKVIFISGHDNDSGAAVTQAGAYAFFTKPVDNQTFLEAVRRALGESASRNNGEV